VKLDSAVEATEPFADLARGTQIIAEEYVDFARELSALVVHHRPVSGGRDLGNRCSAMGSASRP
jgi:phosphoribosylaminoimidazole carboxylase (NCAIR synthetase)